MYYRLIPEVYLVKGSKNAILTNVLTGEIISINSQIKDLIEKAECNYNFSEEIYELDEVCKLKWMQKKDKAIFVEKIRFTNVFNKKRAWKYLPDVQLIILQLTTECSKLCNIEKCYDNFCPMCITSDIKDNNLTYIEWSAIIDQLTQLSSNKVILTGGNPILHKEFEKIYNYCVVKFKEVYIHINDVDDINRCPNNSNVFITLFNEYQREKYKKSHFKNKNIIPLYEYDMKDKFENGININLSNPEISKSSFMNNISLGESFTRRMYDSCLTGKLTILNNGDLVPCLGLHVKKIGNVLSDNIIELIRNLYYAYWEKDVDSREDQKCYKCEFRYNCVSCSKYQNENCQYEVEDGIWI